MKHQSIFLATALLGAALAFPSAHASNVVSRVEHKAVPVLVQVDAHGKVTNITPAFKLRPDVQKRMRSSIQSMITGPREHKGHAVQSQLVMTIMPKVSLRPDGKYDVRMVSVKNQPVPTGSWYWMEDSRHRLALASENDRNMWRGMRQGRRNNFYQRRQYLHRDRAQCPVQTRTASSTRPSQASSR